MRLIDLAQTLHLSHSTVSRALNPEKQHLISDKVRREVRALADRFNYRPRPSTRGATSSKTNVIGVIFPTLFGSIFFNELLAKTLAGVFHVLQAYPEYQCRVLVLPEDDATYDLSLQTLTKEMDGLIISALCAPYMKAVQFLPPRLKARWKKPAVVLNLEIGQGGGDSCVTFDNQEAVFESMDYLIKKKHRRIAFLHSEESYEEMRRRREGYMKALREYQIPYSTSLERRGQLTSAGGFAATVDLFRSKGGRPTALFCVNDEMAIGAIRALEILQIRCPQDVAVMGFDGLLLGEYIRPRLTTYAQPLKEIAVKGTSLLMDLLQGREKGPQNIFVPGHLIVRDSA